MLNSLKRIVLVTLLLVTFKSYVFSQQNNLALAENSTIVGKIMDKETNLPLPGARVVLTGKNIGAISNSLGEYKILSVPAGDYTLTVTYIGYKNFTKELNINTNTILDLDIKMESGNIIGDEVLVVGDALKGQAKALNQQKTNINITNIVSSDQIGRFPDANVGDALKRIPGITIQNDQGEARFGLVRGTAARLNSVMINGDRIPSAEAENREVQLDLIPADMISQIEVSKVLTPDMDADAIGGSINLQTRAPQERRVAFTLGSTYNFLTGSPAFNGTIIGGDRYLDGKLGVMLSATVFDHILGSDNIEAEWSTDDNGIAYTSDFEIRKYLVQRTRRSFSLGFDYELDKKNKLYVNTIYNWRDDWENRYALNYNGIYAIDDDVNNGFAVEEIRRETKGGIGNDRINFRRLEDQRVFNVGFGGNHLFGDILTMTWQANYAKASEERPNERYIQFTSEEHGLSVDLSDEGKPKINPTNPVDITSYELDELIEEYGYTEDVDFNARVDFELPLASGEYKSILKFGGRLRTKTKLRENNFYEYEPNNFTLDDLSNAEYKDETKSDFLPGDYRSGNFATREYLGNLDLNNANLFEKSLALGEFADGNFEASENIFGGYAMITQNIGDKLLILGGFRIENTGLEYTANQFDEENDEELSDVEKITESDNYLNFLPNIQLKYNITESFFGRVAFTQTLARPNYFDLAPYRIINPEDNEIAIGNPELRPTLSSNFDVLFDYYFKSVGIVSGGFFYKDLKDYTYTYQNTNKPEFDLNGDGVIDPDTEIFDELSQPLNGSEASLYGFEIALQRQLEFLPSFLKNLSIYFNYTYTTSEATGVPERGTIALPGTAKNMFNASISYEDKYVSIRIAANYASDYIDELGGEAFEDRYYDEQFFLDANASVNLLKNLRFFVEANNITNQPLRYYQGIQSRLMQAEYYNIRINTGLKWNL